MKQAHHRIYIGWLLALLRFLFREVSPDISHSLIRL
jgi:hypothetical protein